MNTMAIQVTTRDLRSSRGRERQRTNRTWTWKSGRAALVCASMVLSSADALAATFMVTRTSDTHDADPGNGVCADSAGRCSLRAAAEEANARPGSDAIWLQAKTYVLSLGTLTISDQVAVLGAGQSSTYIDGGGRSRVLLLSPQLPQWFLFTHFADLTIQNGRGARLEGGAGVYIRTGSQFRGERITIRNNESTSLAGGGLAIEGEFLCEDCTVSDNRTPTNAEGGLMYSGGGLYLFSGAGAWLTRTTISGNTAVRGGGIAGGGYLEMWNCTISGNTALAGGGGFKSMYSDANWRIGFSTIARNRANTRPGREPRLGGGIYHTAGSIQVGKTLFAENTDGQTPGDPNFGPECATNGSLQLISHRDNIFRHMGRTCSVMDATGGNWTGDRAGWDNQPLNVPIEGLKDNGGYTSTHKLLPGNVAIDDVTAGNPTGFWLFECPVIIDHDQTLSSRPRGAACDVGSYEAR